MDILLAGGFLASESSGYPPEGFSCNGTRVVEVVQLARAAFVSLFPRQNVAHTLTFTTTRVYPTCAAAQLASLLALTTPQDSGLLEVRCGAPGEVLQSVYFAVAAASATTSATVGCASSVQWTILASGPSTAVPPALIFDPDTPNTMRGKIAIPIGTASVPIAFNPPLNNPVLSSLTVETPPGQTTIGIKTAESVSNAGATAIISAAPTVNGYFLHWQAIAGQ